MNRSALLCAGAALSVAAVTACSSPADTGDDAAATGPAAATGSASSAGQGDPAAACAGLPEMQTTVYPGGDPDAPPPTTEQLRDWATAVRPSFETVAANVPDDLADEIATLRAAVDGADAGIPIDLADPAVPGASTALDSWAHGACGFTTLDVVNTGTELTGVPATLPAGPLSVSFRNDGPPDQAGFVALVAELQDGSTVTPEQVVSGEVQFEDVVQSISAAQPGSDPVGYTTMSLTPGRYLVVTPLGGPPEFGGLVATEFRVD